jgi:secreted Zn-dependent insulinase-like peptidase
MLIKSEIEILPAPKKPPCDHKQYKLVKLPNGLKALLVKNAENLKNNLAAVALCIDVGSFDDPLQLQGLAHFLEHMVFMGSSKYPKENEFDQFIKNRNGFDNAMTEVQHTIFYFKLGQEHLSGALDRFSQFFINPLLHSDSMERELEAVESEFQSNIYSDTYRINQIYATLARDQHCVGNFTWGNFSTLKNGIDSESLHQIVHEFRKRFYKSNRMNLCIQSSMDLNILQAIVERYFSDIKPELGSMLKQISIDPFTDVFKSDFYRKVYYVKSMTKKRKLHMTFLLPAIESDYKNKSLDYLAYLFTYEGRYSLMSYLKKRALALHITAKIGGRNFEGNSMFTFFTIEMGLTREGSESVEKILDAIFSYLLIIKMTPMGEHKVIYDELKEIKNMLYMYRNERQLLENVQELALNMKYCKDEDAVVGREEYPEFDENGLRKFISLMNEKKFNLLMLCDNYRKFDKTEKWFGTEYCEIGKF